MQIITIKIRESCQPIYHLFPDFLDGIRTYFMIFQIVRSMNIFMESVDEHPGHHYVPVRSTVEKTRVIRKEDVPDNRRFGRKGFGGSMPFSRKPGLTGKVYIPKENVLVVKKYDCKGCYSCQLCGDDRCALCRPQQKGCGVTCKRHSEIG